jgi:hypothetical protein
MSKVKHIALLKFKDGTSEEQITKLFDELLDLSETVDGIEDYVSGSNTSPEGKSAGYTHGFIMTFSDSTARDNYIVHPEHKKFQEGATAVVDSVVVFDFEV